MRYLLLSVLLVFCSLGKNLQDWQVISYMNNITGLISSGNLLWVSTTGGAYSFNILDSTFVRYTNVEGLGSIKLTSLASDQYRNIYFGSTDGILSVYNIDANRWQTYNELESKTINDLYVKGDTLWAATAQGVAVYRISENQSQYRDLYENLPVTPKQVRRVLIYNNSVFLATDVGLLYAPSNYGRYNLKDAGVWEIFDINSGIQSNSINDIIESGGILIGGNDSGLFTIDKNYISKFSDNWNFGAATHLIASASTPYVISSNKMYAYQNQSWLLMEAFLKPVTCGIKDAAGDLWVGLQDRGIRNSTSSKSLIMDGPSNNFIGSLTKDKKNNLWMMSGMKFSPTRNGFYLYNSHYWENFFFTGPSRIDWKNSTSTVYTDLNGDVWIGSWGGGVAFIKSDEIVCYHPFTGGGTLSISNYMGERQIDIDEVPEERRYCFPPVDEKTTPFSIYISQFLCDSQGNLWCADYQASGGNCIVVLPRLEDGSYPRDCEDWLYYGPNLNLSGSQIQISCLEFDYFGRLWFGTRDDGVYILDYNHTLFDLYDDKLYVPEGRDNLLSNKILSLGMDHDGIMWIGTAGGLNSYDGRQMYRHLGESGELGPVNNTINQVFVDLYNNKWFATDGGVSILDASKSPWDPDAWNHYTQDNSGLPSKYVKSIYIDNQLGEAYIGTDAGLAIFRGLFAQLRTNYSEISAGPNPFILSENSEFVIKNLMVKSTVKIFTLNAKLIRTLSPNNGNVQGSRAFWDGRDSQNNLVSSGIYLYLAHAEDGTATQGKIAVIRP